MGLLDKTKDRIVDAKEDRSERAKRKEDQKAERARLEAEEIVEKERQALAKEKEATLELLSQCQAEAQELGLSLSEYFAFRSFKETHELSENLKRVLRDVGSIKTDTAISNLNSSVALMNSQLDKLNNR